MVSVSFLVDSNKTNNYFLNNDEKWIWNFFLEKNVLDKKLELSS